jgi:hypothetical protein
LSSQRTLVHQNIHARELLAESAITAGNKKAIAKNFSNTIKISFSHLLIHWKK